MFDTLNTRTISGFPVSIGTSLSFESIFTPRLPVYDPAREIPSRVNITDYNYFYISVSTLFRNLMGSLKKEDSRRVLPKELSQALVEEMEFISGLVHTESNSRTIVIFYVNNYSDLQSSDFISHLRVATTENQKIYKHLHDTTLDLLTKNHEEIEIFKSKIKPVSRAKALILTHVPYDLICYSDCIKLDLIESHTGKLKHYTDFNTKYYDGKLVNMFPFNELLLKIMGDHEMIIPFNIKIRKEIIELAKESRWTPVTTVSKVKNDLTKLSNPFAVDTIKLLY